MHSLNYERTPNGYKLTNPETGQVVYNISYARPVYGLWKLFRYHGAAEFEELVTFRSLEAIKYYALADFIEHYNHVENKFNR